MQSRVVARDTEHDYFMPQRSPCPSAARFTPTSRASTSIVAILGHEPLAWTTGAGGPRGSRRCGPGSHRSRKPIAEAVTVGGSRPSPHRGCAAALEAPHDPVKAALAADQLRQEMVSRVSKGQRDTLAPFREAL